MNAFWKRKPATLTEKVGQTITQVSSQLTHQESTTDRILRIIQHTLLYFALFLAGYLTAVLQELLLRTGV